MQWVGQEGETHFFVLAKVLAENSQVGQLLGHVRMVHTQELDMT